MIVPIDKIKAHHRIKRCWITSFRVSNILELVFRFSCSNGSETSGIGVLSSIRLIASSAVTTDGGGFFVSPFILARFQNGRRWFPRLSLRRCCRFTLSLLRFFFSLFFFFSSVLFLSSFLSRTNASRERKKKTRRTMQCYYINRRPTKQTHTERKREKIRTLIYYFAFRG